MLERDLNVHHGCPNRHHCKKDETKCCYLVNDHCILRREDCERFLV